MINLNPFILSGLLISFTYLPLFLFILIKGKTKLTRIYSYHLLSVFWWGIFSVILPIIQESNTSEFFWRMSNIGVFLIPTFFLHAVYILTNKKKNFLIAYAYIQSIFIILVVLFGDPFSTMRYFYSSFFVPTANKIYIFGFINWIILCSIAHITLIKHYTKNFPNERKLIILLFISIIGFLGGTCNFLPIFGFNIYQYGNFLVPIHSLVITYAILKYQFLNIELAFKKGLVYSTLLILVLLFYTLTVLIFERYLQVYFGYNSLGLSVIAAFIIGVLIIPLRNKIQFHIDKIFFRRAPQELEKENELLRQEIAQTDKLKSIATFASGMAHEIKNPLTSIKVFCEYLPQRVNDKVFLDKFIPIVIREADRINELVHDLLDYAKPSPPELKPANIHKVVDDVLGAVSAQIINKKIRTIRDYDLKNIKNIEMDEKQIKQALLNIILNAIESMTEDGVITFNTNISTDSKKIILRITDTGCGISLEDLPRVFDPFFTKKEKGTGLGLSITHGIIKEHGGKIFVDSKLGQGTTFRIELPVT